MPSTPDFLRRIALGIHRPINAMPVPTPEQVYHDAEKEGMAVQKANVNRCRKPKS